MAYQLTKELQKFIFSIMVLATLVVGMVVIISSQFEVSADFSDVELYNGYVVYRDCSECDLDICVDCEGENCKTYGLIDEVNVCYE